MRLLTLCLMLCGCTPAWCEDIQSVLDRSHAQRLAALTEQAPSPAAAQRIAESFQQLLRAMPPLGRPVSLQVVQAPLLAETLQGQVIVANESLAQLPEDERQFVLAHELGHVALGHWQQLGELYRAHVPGEVVPEATAPVAARLGRAASALSHQQEYEADAYGLDALIRMGWPPEAVHRFFMRAGVMRDTATHPATGKRLAHLRARLGR